MTQPVNDPNYLPTATLVTLQRRAALLRFVRQYFDSHGYFEVETPLLSQEIVVDAHLDPFVVEERPSLFLQTSPEFGMKRLLAAGAEAIYQITRAFRRGEAGAMHNPEFTICEWYRVGDTHHEQMDFVESLTGAVFEEFSESPLPMESFERLTYDSAFERHLGTKVLHLDCDALSQLAILNDVTPPQSLRHNDRDGWLNLLLATCVEPHLGNDLPLFLYDYPASQAALAKVRHENPPVAERFELYIRGVEICNGYHELLVAEELRRRNAEQSRLREIEGSRPLPTDSRLLAAMEAGLPPCSGVALGLDRLAMLAFGLSRIDKVIAFPFERA